MLDEVVVVGYGVQKKKLVTGATVQVKGENIAKLNTTNPLSALQGQTPGVNIVSTSGQPGASLSTINSSRSRIFQYIDTFNISRIQSRNVATHTIDKMRLRLLFMVLRLPMV